MTNHRMIYSMNKRGVIQIVAWLLIAITTAGIGITAVYNSSPLYIGNSDTNEYFDYNQCKHLLKTIDEKNVVAFKTKVEAENLGYNAIEGCV